MKVFRRVSATWHFDVLGMFPSKKKKHSDYRTKLPTSAWFDREMDDLYTPQRSRFTLTNHSISEIRSRDWSVFEITVIVHAGLACWRPLRGTACG